ncbi:MAG TPA: CapA family protein [Chthoniobacteraceae bacterium]|nr:CapA family protein [Chthoniobacteraceae bacterium]
MKATLTALGDVAAVGSFRKRLLEEPLEAVIDPELIDLLRASDACIANVECVLTGVETFTIPGYGLRTSPRLAPTFRALGITIATLANNHIRDVGDAGVLDTIRHLQAAGMATCGAGENVRAASAPLYFSAGGLRFGLLAVAEREDNLADEERAGSAFFQPETWAADIAGLRRNCDVALVSVHAGHEFAPVPSPRIRAACRAAVDAGADVVLGHHPHVPQGIERRGGGVIFYSLGNFCFDSDYVCGYNGWEIGLVPEITFSGGRIDFTVHPVRIGREGSVSLLRGDEREAFLKRLNHLCQLVADDAAFAAAWRNHVQWRFERDYLPHLERLGERLGGDESRRYSRFYRNYFRCPTHQELIADYLSQSMRSEPFSATK